MAWVVHRTGEGDPPGFRDYKVTVESGVEDRHTAVGIAAVLERETGDTHGVRHV